MLDEGADTGATGAVEKALYDPDLHVRTQALLYVAHHTQVDPLDRIEQIGDFADFSIRAAMVTFLSQPGKHENLDAARLLLDRMLQDDAMEARLEASRLLELLPDQFEDQIRDRAHVGLDRAGALRDPRRWPPAQAAAGGTRHRAAGRSRAGRGVHRGARELR